MLKLNPKISMTIRQMAYLPVALVIGFALFFQAQVTLAQTANKTIWCNPVNTGTEDGLTKATGYKTIYTAAGHMAGGDTLIIADGDWSAYAQMDISSANGGTYLPPSGLDPAHMTIVRAETDWGVKISRISDSGTGRSYMYIRGIIVPNGIGLYGWNYSKIVRCGVFQPKVTGNAATFSLHSSSYSLVEECIAWGGGRYKFLDYQGHHNVFRRCLARHDWYISPEWHGQEANFRGYSTSNSTWQNCISIDSDRGQYYDTASAEGGDYWVDSSYNTVDSCFSIKGMATAYYMPAYSGTGTLKNSVALGPFLEGVVPLASGAYVKNGATLNVENSLFFDIDTPNQVVWRASGSPLNVVNSIARDTGANAASSVKYSYFYNVRGGVSGEGNVNTDPFENGLLYPVGVEQGYVLATAGSNGGRVGPEILYKIGRDEDGDGICGLAYGEAGWDEVQDGKEGRQFDPLWPFPNENKIKELMRHSVDVDGVDLGDYGFCADGAKSLDGLAQTLTKYIWEYFGNPIPADIYRTIWCNPDNSGIEDGLSKASGYRTLWTAMSKMAPGDTVIIANGNWVTYPEMDMYDSKLPPSGAPGKYSRVRAETDWQVWLPNIFSYRARSYVEVRGIIFDSRKNPAGHVVYDWHHTKFIRCGFLAGKITGNSHTCGFGSADSTRSLNQHNLMEECIAWGAGRYIFYNKYAQYNVFRRCIARHDFNGAGADAGQIANFRSYACDYSAYQNCISLDSDRTQYYNNGTLNGEASGYWVGDSYGSLGHQIQGSISIKDLNMAYYLSGHEYNRANPNAYTVIKDSLALSPRHINGGTTLNGFILSNHCNITADNLLGFDATTDINSRGYNDKRGTPFIIKNSIALKVTGAGEVSTENSYMSYYQVGGGNWGIGSVSYDPQANGLLYPVRIEAGSPLATAGENGTRIGPEILCQIGRDADGDGICGLLYGEAGWDELQDGKEGRPLRKLWPWPNEDKIKELMSKTVEGVPGIYGFTAYQSPFGSPNTLTSYIWEYLGNKIPDEVYGTVPEPEVAYGDISGDGKVSMYDAALVAQYAIGLVTLTAEQQQRADVSGDGKISMYDAALIAQRALGLITKFPVE